MPRLGSRVRISFLAIFFGWMAEGLCSSLQSYICQFDSDSSLFICPDGEIGIRKGLKIPRRFLLAGSSPALGIYYMKDYKDIFTIKVSAIKYFEKLLIEEKSTDVNLRIFIINPGTLIAEVNLTYCYSEDIINDDLVLLFDKFKLYVQKDSIVFLKDCIIEYISNDNQKKLSINAPNMKKKIPNKISLKTKINYIIDNEINIILSNHNGKIELDSIIDNNIVLIKFVGGCQGCSMAGVTLNKYIEKILKKYCTEITEIRDITDHKLGVDQYF